MNIYENPLCSRYASYDMKNIFSPEFKFSTWRKLWYSLAKNEKKLGLDIITDEMLDEMNSNIYDIDFKLANEFEKKLRHDVMAHVHTFAQKCPKASPIIHLGATSAFVVDNTDLIQIRQALILIKKRLLTVINTLCDFSMKYSNLPTLGYTHFQPAQLTTVGKRATLWINSLMYDIKRLDYTLENLEFRGVKGTTGTLASFKDLFNNDYEKVCMLNDLVTKDFGFNKYQLVSGQTYDRKQDSFVLQVLADIASSCHKFTNDFRLLQHLKELEEPFEKNQIGSSAMAYKRNPMRCERISSLCKYVMSLQLNGHLVHSTQWFERTLDDSANKRLSYPQAFLAVDSILIIMQNICDGIVVYKKMIEKNIKNELPFIATENIIMQAVKNGMDRQQAHEIIRQLSMKQADLIKNHGKKNNLINEIIKDGRIIITNEQLKDILNAKNYIGFSDVQTKQYIREVRKYIKKNKQYFLENKEKLEI